MVGLTPQHSANTRWPARSPKRIEIFPASRFFIALVFSWPVKDAQERICGREQSRGQTKHIEEKRTRRAYPWLEAPEETRTWQSSPVGTVLARHESLALVFLQPYNLSLTHLSLAGRCLHVHRRSKIFLANESPCTESEAKQDNDFGHTQCTRQVALSSFEVMKPCTQLFRAEAAEDP